MKKIFITVISLMVLLFPSVSLAELSQSKIQKEMVIARYQVDKDYWVELVQKIDKLFVTKIINNDMELFKSLNTKLNSYFSKKSLNGYLNKKKVKKKQYNQNRSPLKLTASLLIMGPITISNLSP